MWHMAHLPIWSLSFGTVETAPLKIPEPRCLITADARALFCISPQAFSAWIHMSMVRLFVESILRYGLPPAFQAATMRLGDKVEGRSRNIMATTFGDGEGEGYGSRAEP